MRKQNKSGTPLWRVEQDRKLHNTLVVQMDHKVNGDMLQQALEKTLRVYPVVAASVIVENGVTYFMDNDRPCVILQGKKGFLPGCEKLGGHQFYVAYEDDTVRMALSHVITDGGGMFSFAKTLIYFYCCIHDGKTYDSKGVRTDEGGSDEQFADFWTLDYSDIPDVSEASFEKQGYVLPESTDTVDRPYILSEIAIPADAFMHMVKEKSASPSVMAFLLFSGAVYMVRGDAKAQPVVGRITVDARKALGIPDTFMNCSLGAQLSIRQTDFATKEPQELAKELRGSLKEQTRADYLRYVAKKVALAHAFPQDVRPTVSISYMGELSFGEYGHRIRNVSLYEGEFHKMNVCAFNGAFRFWLHMGDGSERYAKAMVDILANDGITANVTENIVLENEEK